MRVGVRVRVSALISSRAKKPSQVKSQVKSRLERTDLIACEESACELLVEVLELVGAPPRAQLGFARREEGEVLAHVPGEEGETEEGETEEGETEDRGQRISTTGWVLGQRTMEPYDGDST
jgi:hypothetical protein